MPSTVILISNYYLELTPKSYKLIRTVVSNINLATHYYHPPHFIPFTYQEKKKLAMPVLLKWLPKKLNNNNNNNNDLSQHARKVFVITTLEMRVYVSLLVFSLR